jgi:hypothetical protein
MLEQLLIVWNNPLASREDEYNRWYSEVHIGDLLRIDGVGAASRFVRHDAAYAPGRPRALHRYLAVYELLDRYQVMRAIPKRRGTAAMMLTDALDRSTSQATYVQAVDAPDVIRQVRANAEHAAALRYLAVVRMSHAPGHREALEDWFMTAHLDQVRDGWDDLDGRLFTLTVEQLRPHQPYAYFGVYTMDQTPGPQRRSVTDVLEAIRASIEAQAGLFHADFQIDAYVPIGPRRDKSSIGI